MLFHSITCYTNSIASRIHVNTTILCNIMCTLVATGMILWSVECTLNCPINVSHTNFLELIIIFLSY